MIITEAAHASAMPIIRASKAPRGPQLWYTGSAVDQEMHDHGVVWTRVRERGIAGDDEALAYFEWSLDVEHPDDVPDEVADDPELWRRVNFAIARGRVTEEHMEWERRAMSRPRRSRSSCSASGDYPATDGVRGRADLGGGVGRRCRTRSRCWSTRSASRSTCRRTGSRRSWRLAGTSRGRWLVEVIARGRRHRLADGAAARSCTGRMRSRRSCVTGTGPSAAIARKVDEAGITVRRLDSGDYGKACGLFVDAVGETDAAASGAGRAGRGDPGREGPAAGGPVGVVADEVDGEHLAAGGGDVGAAGRRSRTTSERWRSSDGFRAG